MQKKEKNCETHAYAKKYEKHNDAKKGKWETHDYKKKTTIMQTNKWETRNYAKAKKEAAHRYICNSAEQTKICKTENKQ